MTFKHLVGKSTLKEGIAIHKNFESPDLGQKKDITLVYANNQSVQVVHFEKKIDLGTLITPTLGFANILCEIGRQKALQRGRKTYSGMMHFEKAFKEFQYLRPIFDIPIVILGIDISPL